MKFIFKVIAHLCLFIMFFAALTSAGFAQTSNNGVDIRQTRISTISKSIEENNINPTEARGALRLIRNEAREAIESLSEEKQDIQSQLTELGPLPSDGRVEPTDIKDRRKFLTDKLANTESLIAQAKLNEADSNRELNKLVQSQRHSLLSEVLSPERSALSPSLWRDASTSASTLAEKLPAHYSQWKSSRQELGVWDRNKVQLLGLVLLLGPFQLLIKFWATGVFTRKMTKREPQALSRYALLAFNITVRTLPTAIGLCIIYQSLMSTAFLNAAYAPALRTLIYAILLVLFTRGMAVSIFNPSQASWRIIPLEDKPARVALTVSVVAITLFALGWIASSFSKVGPEWISLGSVATIFMAIAVSALALIPARNTNWSLQPDRAEEISPAAKRRWVSLTKIKTPLILIILASLVFGYLNLAYFITVRLILLLGLLLTVWVIRKFFIKVINTLDKNLSHKLDKTKSSSRQAMLFWSGLFVDGFIFVALIPILLLALGVDSYSVRTGMMDAFTGITIGNFRFSIADILAGIAIFFIIIFVTRFLQRTLDVRLFEKSGADIGFRNSFRTLLGYLGLIIAIFAAIGVIGLDLSNLAIIAGALSVGIGFGLQSIVNNFVSGLILLFERPVKVGDWVVTQSGEGVVKQISVRSTEIETFDRASIIVPNSELISSSVTNWTHKNKIGRVVIPVGVAYDSDAKHVREILIKTALTHPRVLKSPEPFVYFREFGASSLDLDLRVFIQNVSEGSLVKNDLRFEILDAFRAENIDIPFPQQDVNLKK